MAFKSHPSQAMESYKRTKATNFFYNVSLMVYLCGISQCSIQDLKLSKTFTRIYDRFTSFGDALIYILLVLEIGAFFTQHNLTETQMSNLILYGVSHPLLFILRGVLLRDKNKVRDAIYTLTVALKKVHNDEEVEKQMMKRTVMSLTVLIGSCIVAMVMYTVDALMDVIQNRATFTTIITAWPDVEDTSHLASVVRAVSYIVWWLLMTRFFGFYIVVISLTTGLSHQYKNLQSFFRTLDDIFDVHDLTRKEKENKYEAAFKVGIKIHSDTLRCTQVCQSLCEGLFSGQIIFNTLVIAILLTQLASAERNLVNLFAAATSASAVLISTGFFICNSGDITIEASNLSTAMYFSGWHNCCGESEARVRKLVVISMSHAQTPVVLKAFGFIDLSYQSYITIVKSSYSVFSVLY